MISRLGLGIVVYSALLALFPVVAAAGNDIKLLAPRTKGPVSVESAMTAVKSYRSFSSTPLTLAQLSQILWAANGDRAPDAITGATRKMIPSAGGLYPLEVFVLSGTDTVVGLPPGVYQYVPASHSLRMIDPKDQRTLAAHAALSQMWLARAPAMIIIGAVFARTTWKYGPRGRNYALMEAGNCNQNIYLQAAALGLHTGTVGAFHDPGLKAAVKLPANVAPLLLMAIGK